MSWNSSIQFAKLYKAFLTLSTTALTNPMVANLNMATYSINNVNTISAVSGNTLSLSADASQGITVNTKLLIPNHPLVITNNTVNDSLQVHDTTSDVSIFRVDHNGNVAIKSDSSTTLTNAFTVNGESSCTGSITCSGLTSTTGAFSTSLTATTRSSGDNTTNVATTAFVNSAVTGNISCTGLTSGTGAFSTSLTAPTRSSGDNTTNVATTAFVNSAVTGNISCTGLTSGTGAFSTSLTAPTRSSGDFSTNVATTAYVQSAISGTGGSLRPIVMPTNGTPVDITVDQIANCFIFCNGPAPVTAQTINIPQASSLATYFGANAVITFFIGHLNVTQFNPSYPNIALQVGLIGAGEGTNDYWSTNYTTQAPNSALTTKVWTSFFTSFAFLFPGLYRVQITIQGGKAYQYYEYAGFAFP